MGVTVTKELFEPLVGWESCVGVLCKNYPLDFGNYFSLDCGLRITNMWSENLREFSKRNPHVDKIECTVYSDGTNKLGTVSDCRIPKDWLIKDRLCVTGCGWGSRELAEYILNDQGFVIGSHICGCEKLYQPPRISTSFRFGDPETTYICTNCKRIWKD